MTAPTFGPGKRLRAGTQVHRTLYLHEGDDLKGVLIGVMDTAELAAHVVQAANAWDWNTNQTATDTAIQKLAGLHTALVARRRERGLSLRAAAEEIGIGFNTITRLEKGHDVTLDSAIAVLRWLDKQETNPT